MGNKNDNDVGSNTAISKWVPTIVLVSTVVGFVSLAWYAYHTGRQSVKEEDLLVIESEKTPMKEKPEDPGGMKFPNQDKTIFETFSYNQPVAKVERVLPAPEEPIDKKEMLEAIIEQNNNKKMDDGENAKTSETTHAEVKKAEEPIINSKEPVTEKTSEKTNEPKPGDPNLSEKSSVKSGTVKVQLGAYRSEKEANENWIKIKKKFPALTDKSPIIVRVDVKGKGIFYRLRVGGFSSKSDAKSFCATLSAKGQACILPNG